MKCPAFGAHNAGSIFAPALQHLFLRAPILSTKHPDHSTLCGDPSFTYSVDIDRELQMSRVTLTNPFDLLTDENEDRTNVPAKKEQKPAAPAAKPAAKPAATSAAVAKPAAKPDAKGM